MKQLITTAVLLFNATAFAQVGINNTSPKATLDISPKTTDGSKPEGLLIPQLDGNTLKTTAYGTIQKGVIVYAKSAASPTDAKTINVTAEGYYYYDGSVWQKIVTGSTLNTALTSGNIYVGNTSNVATSVAPTGDVTISNTGVTSIGTGKVTSSQIADGTIANADLASVAALTVKGNATNAAATPTDIVAGTDGYVLRRSGTALGFGTVATAGIADNAVTVAKLPSGASATTFLRGDGTWVTPTDTNTTYTAGNGLTLSGTNMKLGGALTEATTITSNGKTLSVNNNSATSGNTFRIDTGAGTTGYSQGSNGRFDIDAANVGGGRFTVLENGNVGIGTASPGSKLEVAGAVKIVDGTQGSGKVLTSDANGLASWANTVGDNLGNHTATQNIDLNGKELRLKTSTDGNHKLVYDTTTDGPLLYGYSGGALSTLNGGDKKVLTWNSGGNVGIGTTSPGAKLEVAGQVKITGGTPGNGKVLTSDANGLASWANTVGDNLGNHSATQDVVMNDKQILFRSFGDTNHGLSFNNSLNGPRLWGLVAGVLGTANGTNALIWNSSGNVGIGTSSPTAALHTYSASTSNAFQMQDGSQGAGKFLSSDADGKATWVNTPFVSSVVGGNFTTVSSFPGGGVPRSMGSITLNKGKWIVTWTLQLGPTGTFSYPQSFHIISRLSSNNSTYSTTGFVVNSGPFGTLTGSIISGQPYLGQLRGATSIEVTANSITLYILTAINDGGSMSPSNVSFQAGYGENGIYAQPVN